MAQEGVQRLVEFCRRRTGENLRAVVAYDDGGHEVGYVRDDLEAAVPTETFDELVELAREFHGMIYPLRDAETPAGGHTASVHGFDDAVVIQLAVDADRGCLVSFDRDVGSNVTEFIDQCRARLEGEA